MSKRVLVAGATGGVGQLTVAQLLESGNSVRVLSRSSQKAEQMFDGKVEVAIGDTLDPSTLAEAMQEVTHLICCTGTTAFPSSKWNIETDLEANGVQRLLEWSNLIFNVNYRRTKARNSPEQVDAEGVRNLVAAAPKDLQRFVYVSSCGVERKDKPPYNLLNAFGVLDAKQKGETAVIQSGFPYTIIRPGRLIDGPFTSFDLNTLLKAKTNGKFGVVIGTGDQLNGQTSRIDVAAACVESLNYSATENQIFELISKGVRPAQIDWAALFAQLPSRPHGNDRLLVN
jgi:uncharacterized protein YbjT (DUF2867 family)